MDEGRWVTINGNRVFIGEDKKLRKEKNNDIKERLKNEQKLKSQNPDNTLKNQQENDIMNMSTKEEVTKYFKDNYNIELANIDKLTVDEIKPALSGTYDFIKDFPEAGKFIKRIEYYPGLSGRCADMGGDGLMRIRKDGFGKYKIGVHESAHALDFKRSFIFDKETYSEGIIKEVLKEKGIRINSREYDELMFAYSIPMNYSKEEYNIELFAFSLQDYYSNNDTSGIGRLIFQKIKGGK